MNAIRIFGAVSYRLFLHTGFSNSLTKMTPFTEKNRETRDSVQKSGLFQSSVQSTFLVLVPVFIYIVILLKSQDLVKTSILNLVLIHSFESVKFCYQLSSALIQLNHQGRSRSTQFNLSTTTNNAVQYNIPNADLKPI